jgi:putative transposase
VEYHVVWCLKYRCSVLGCAVKLRLKQTIGEVVAEFGVLVIEVETMPDHVHLLVELPPVGGSPLEVVRRSVENQKLAAARIQKAA